MPPEFTEEELERLTPEERAAVTADDDTSDMQAILDDDGEADDDESSGSAVDPAGGPTAKEDDGSTATAATNLDPAGILAEDDSTPTAAFRAEPVEDYDGKVAAAESKRDEAFKKMMDGDLSADEYRAIEKEATKVLRELDAQQNEYRIAQSMTQQAAQNAWADYVNTTLSTAKTNGADLLGDTAIAKELDRTVKLLAAQVAADPEMLKDVPPTKPGALITNGDKWILQEAMSIVAARHGMTLGKPKAGQDNDKAQPANKTRQPDLSNVPPTLSRVPVSAEASTGGDEFAHLKSLQGADYEKALARLTPDQLDRFMG